MRTQVGIIGAGPAGLALSHLLHLHGIESVILESRSREYVEGRVRAGVLDNDVSRLLRATGLGERMDREGLIQERMEFRFDGKSRVMHWSALAGGRQNVVYGQQEVVRDIIDKRLEDGGTILFDAPATAISGISGSAVEIAYDDAGRTGVLECDFIAGCDGYHGVARPAIPSQAMRVYEREYPYSWIGILADVPPSSEWLISASHDRGFALHSMRSPEVTRLYVQCDATDDLEDWPESRIWGELHVRLASDSWTLNEGPVTERAKIDLRSFVCEPMQHGRLFLAGDSAHVVPPTGGRGLNQAIADACLLADALASYYQTHDRKLLDSYSDDCLERVWVAQHFTNRMSNMMQKSPGQDAFARRVQIAELDLITSNDHHARALAQHYVGEPLKTSFL